MSRTFRTLAALSLAVAVGCKKSEGPAPASTPGRTLDALTAVEDALLLQALPVALDQAGLSVALSADGTLALIGTPRDDIGAGTDVGSVRTFTRGASVWTEGQTLAASANTAGNNDQLGFSVALSADGTRALVGAPYGDTAGGTDTGSARVFLRSGATWVEEALLVPPDALPNDLVGIAVALSADGRRAFLGAPGDDTVAGSNAGSVRAFVRNAGGWAEDGTLLASGAAAGDQLGLAVATNGDGLVAIAGARADTTPAGLNAGSARVFERGGTGWTEQAVLLAAGGAASDAFGSAVAIDAAGNSVLVSAPNNDTAVATDSGSVRWFSRTARGGAWTEGAALLPTSTAETPAFGIALALRADGLRALVGSPLAASNAGAARIYTFSSGAWAPDALLTFSQAKAGSLFGTAVALAADSATALVGAPGHDHTSATDDGAGVAFGLTALAAGASCSTSTQCTSGVCVDGFCCNEACGNGATNTCVACALARTGLPNGTCGLVAAGTVCRAAAGTCDRVEVCDGASTICPGNELLGAGVVCRSAANICDAEERCSGTSPTCPANAVLPANTPCRPAFGPCDLADVCNGSTVFCLETVQPAGTVCNATVADVCDAPDVCNGTSPSCPPLYLSGVECRAAAGTCDLTEYCNGSMAPCPPDNVLAAGPVCRSSTALPCDPAEQCDGVSQQCPQDVNSCDPDVPTQCRACPPPKCSTTGGAPLASLLAMLAVGLSRRRR